MQIKGAEVFVHWSVLLIGVLILLGAVEDPLRAFTVLVSYYSVILLHECGHSSRHCAEDVTCRRLNSIQFGV
jgi:hypothetical protein